MSNPAVWFLLAVIGLETAFIVRVSLDLREARRETKEAVAALEGLAKHPRMIKKAAVEAQKAIAGIIRR